MQPSSRGEAEVRGDAGQGGQAERQSALSGGTTNLEVELLDSVLSAYLVALESQAGSIALYDRESQELLLSAARGPCTDQITGARQRIGEGVSGYVAATRKPLLVYDISTDRRFRQRASARYSSSSFVAVPVCADDKLLGVVSVTNPMNRPTYCEGDLQLLETLVKGLGLTLERLGRVELDRETVAALAEHYRLVLSCLERQNVYYKSVLESLPLALMSFDADCHAVFMNKTFRHLFEFTPERADKPVSALDVVADDEKWRKALTDVLREGKRVFLEKLTLLRRDGESFRLDVAAEPIRLADGQHLGGLVIAQDVSDRARLEKQLIASERFAAVGQLASKVAHELNNPLDGVIRFVTMALGHTESGSKLNTYLVHSKEGLRRMAAIVSSLLEFSRSAHNARPGAPVNLVIQEVVNLYQHKASLQRVKIVTELSENETELESAGLFQVLGNVIDNALNAMPAGGVLTIKTTFDDRVQVAISDTGVGMSKEVQQHIFDPFFTTNKDGKGTGLGLAICKELVEKKYGGQIAVQSEEGKGATFIITLPMPRQSG